MELTKRQAIYMIVICLLATKVQRLPSLVATPLGRHGFLVFLIMGAIDILMLLLCLLFKRLSHGKTTYAVIEATGGKFFSKLIYFLLFLYFLFNCILPYESIHDLFGNILFDQLSWEIYSLLLVGTLIFVASRGLKNLGRLSEVFFYLILISLITLMILGGMTTDFNATLPLCDLNGKALAETCFKYNLWFGDFLIIYMFVGKIKDDSKSFAFSATLAMTISTILISLSYVIYYGLYRVLAPEQNSLISSISQFALLDLDIGRVDWFFVLFFQLGAVISSCVYLFLAASALQKVVYEKSLKSEKYDLVQNIILLSLAAVIYLLDILVFKSNQQGVAIMATITKFFSAFIILVLPIILLIIALVFNKKRKSQEKNVYNRFNSLKFIKKAKAVKPSKVKTMQKKPLRFEEGQ